MICRCHALLLSLLLGCVLPLPAQDVPNSPELGTIQGTVIDLRTSQPLPDAQVRLDGRGARNFVSASSDAEGKFIFRGVAPGAYFVIASHAGFSFRSRGFGARSGSLVSVGPGQTIDHLVLPLAPNGVISGRITNDRDEPIGNVYVELANRSYRDGRLSLAPARSAFTDNQGEFRITGIPPGRYCLEAKSPRNWQKGKPPLYVYVPAFFPNVTNPAHAETIDVHPGEELGGLRLNLKLARAVHVQGRIVRADGTPADSADVKLSQFDSNGYTIEVQTNREGKFEASGIPGGLYDLTAQWSANDNSEHVLSARTTLLISDAKKTVPDIVLYPGATVSGLVIQDGDSKPAMPRSVSLVPLVADAVSAGTTTLSADGSFVFQDVAEGRYRLQIRPIPGGYYVRRGADGGADVIVQHGHATSAEVHFDSGAGEIRGVIYQDDGKQIPAASATVVLVPQGDGASDPDDYRLITSNRSGQFVIRNLAPGDYSLLAFQSFDTSEFADPEVVREYERWAQRIRIEKGATLDVQAPVTIPEGSSNAIF
jgi:protocatechuate 3,4-dioxygenase beta subunit